MAVGTDVGFDGNAAPLTGDFELVGRTAATDQVTITRPASATGNAVAVRTSTGTNRFTIGPDGALTLVSGAAGDTLVLVRQAATPTGLPLSIQNSSSSKIFHIATGGDIRTMVLKTVAIASVASNASTSFSLAALTTDDAVLLIALKTLTTGNGILQAFAQGTTRVDVYAEGGSVAANTYAVWAFSTVSN